MKPPIYQIREYVQQIKEEFPFADIRYVFDIEDDQHALFVMPEEILNEHDFIDMETEFTSEFYDKYHKCSDFMLHFPSEEYSFTPGLDNIDLLDPTQFERAEKYHRERAERELKDLRQQIELLEKQLSYKPPK